MKYTDIKIVRSILIIGCTLCFNGAIYGQDNAVADLLVGTWTFSEAPSIQKMSAAMQQDLATSTHLQEHIATFYSGRQLLFTNTGAFSMLLGTGQRTNGQWSLNGSLLTLSLANGSSTNYQIAGIDGANLLLQVSSGGGTDSQLLFPELYFTKN